MQKVIIAGMGFMGQMHAQVYAHLPQAELTAIVDAAPEAARANLQKIHLNPPVYPTLAEALAAHPQATVVDICLPTPLHRPVAFEAIAAGRHLFCEKPLALSAEDAEAIAAFARERGVALQVGHVVRFFPEYRAAQEWLDSGQGGKLLSVNLTRRAARPRYSQGDWLNDPTRSLGAIFDLHIHDTDYIHHLLGTPKAVTSHGTHDSSGWTHVFTHYHFDDVCVRAEGGWNYPAQWGFRATLELVCEHGALELDTGATPAVRVTVGEAPPRALEVPTAFSASSKGETGNLSSLSGYYDELAHFITTLEQGGHPQIATGEQAARSVRTVLAEIESVETGRTVPLS